MSRKQIKLNHKECHIIIEALQEQGHFSVARHDLIMKMLHLGDLARNRMDYGYTDEDIQEIIDSKKVTQGDE